MRAWRPNSWTKLAKPNQKVASFSIANWRRRWRRIRTGGPNGFYKGQVGARIIAYSQAQGGGIGVPELAGYSAMRNTPQVIEMRNAFVLLASRRTGAGAFAGTLFDNLNRAQSTTTGAGRSAGFRRRMR